MQAIKLVIKDIIGVRIVQLQDGKVGDGGCHTDDPAMGRLTPEGQTAAV